MEVPQPVRAASESPQTLEYSVDKSISCAAAMHWYGPCIPDGMNHVAQLETSRQGSEVMERVSARRLTVQKHLAANRALTPTCFVSEAQEFKLVMRNSLLDANERKRALCLLVNHAGMLKPGDAGFEGAGVALKDALCAWLLPAEVER
jgi:hypothetical protein